MRPVAIVVIESEHVGRRDGASGLGRHVRRAGGRCGEDHLGGVTARKNPFECGSLTPVDSQSIRALDRDDARRVPAAVQRRQPFCEIEGAFSAASAAVHLGRGQGQVEQVGSETPPKIEAGGAEPTVVSLGDGNDVLDVGLSRGRIVPPRVGPVDPASHEGDNLGLDRLRIGVIAPVVRCAAMLRRNDETVPGFGARGLTEIGDACGHDRKRGKHYCRRAAWEPVCSCHRDTPSESCESN